MSLNLPSAKVRILQNGCLATATMTCPRVPGMPLIAVHKTYIEFGKITTLNSLFSKRILKLHYILSNSDLKTGKRRLK